MFVTVTVAPGMALPDGSRTFPRIVPSEDCAFREDQRETNASNAQHDGTSHARIFTATGL
jgi:hypothetical protein